MKIVYIIEECEILPKNEIRKITALSFLGTFVFAELFMIYSQTSNIVLDRRIIPFIVNFHSVVNPAF